MRRCFDCFDSKVVILCGRESETPAKHNKTTEEDDKIGNNQRCSKMAGVSISTVSLAFNNPERVTEATRDKIFDAVRSLNYVPANVNKKTVLSKKKSRRLR